MSDVAKVLGLCGVLLLGGCASLRPALSDCASERAKDVVARNVDRGFRALSQPADAWVHAVDALVREVGAFGACVIKRLALTLPGSRPASVGELRAPLDASREAAGHRAAAWCAVRGC